MIRTPPPPLFVTIEGQLFSVRTVINMLHFLNQWIVYTIWKLWPICKRGNKWEMLSYGAWTDGRTAVCHNKPVFWRAYKNEWSISWNYEYIIFGQIIFQNFHQFKAFVGLSNCRTVGLSDCRTIGLSDYSYGPP